MRLTRGAVGCQHDCYSKKPGPYHCWQTLGDPRCIQAKVNAQIMNLVKIRAVHAQHSRAKRDGLDVCVVHHQSAEQMPADTVLLRKGKACFSWCFLSHRLSGHRGDAHLLNLTQRERMYKVYNLSSANFAYNSCRSHPSLTALHTRPWHPSTG